MANNSRSDTMRRRAPSSLRYLGDGSLPATTVQTGNPKCQILQFNHVTRSYTDYDPRWTDSVKRFLESHHSEYTSEWADSTKSPTILKKEENFRNSRAAAAAIREQYDATRDAALLKSATQLENDTNDKEEAILIKSGEICSAILDFMSPAAYAEFAAKNKKALDHILKESRSIIELRKLMNATCRMSSTHVQSNLTKCEEDFIKSKQREEESIELYTHRMMQKLDRIEEYAGQINEGRKKEFSQRTSTMIYYIESLNIQGHDLKELHNNGELDASDLRELNDKVVEWWKNAEEKANAQGYTKIGEQWHTIWRSQAVERARKSQPKSQFAAAAYGFEESYRQDRASRRQKPQFQGRAAQSLARDQAYASQLKSRAPAKHSAKPAPKFKGKGAISRLESLEPEQRYNNIANSCSYHLQLQKQGLFKQDIMHTAKDCRAMKGVGKNLQQGGAPHRQIGNGTSTRQARQAAPAQRTAGGTVSHRPKSGAPAFFLDEPEYGFTAVKSPSKELIYIPPVAVGLSPEEIAVEDRRVRIEFFVQGPSYKYKISAPSTILGKLLLRWIPGAAAGRVTQRGYKHIDPDVSLGEQGIRDDSVLSLNFFGLGGSGGGDEADDEQIDREVAEFNEAARVQEEADRVRSEAERAATEAFRVECETIDVQREARRSARREMYDFMPDRDEEMALTNGLEIYRQAVDSATSPGAPLPDRASVARAALDIRNIVDHRRKQYNFRFGYGPSNLQRRAEVAGTTCRELGVSPRDALGIAKTFSEFCPDQTEAFNIAFFSGYATGRLMNRNDIAALRRSALEDMIRNPDNFHDERLYIFSWARQYREEYEADLLAARSAPTYRHRRELQDVLRIESQAENRAAAMRAALITRHREETIEWEARHLCQREEAALAESIRRNAVRERERVAAEERIERRRRHPFGQEQMYVQEGVTADGHPVSRTFFRGQALQGDSQALDEHVLRARETYNALSLGGEVLQNYLSNLNYRSAPSHEYVFSITASAPIPVCLSYSREEDLDGRFAGHRATPVDYYRTRFNELANQYVARVEREVASTAGQLDRLTLDNTSATESEHVAPSVAENQTNQLVTSDFPLFSGLTPSVEVFDDFTELPDDTVDSDGWIKAIDEAYLELFATSDAVHFLADEAYRHGSPVEFAFVSSAPAAVTDMEAEQDQDTAPPPAAAEPEPDEAAHREQPEKARSLPSEFSDPERALKPHRRDDSDDEDGPSSAPSGSTPASASHRSFLGSAPRRGSTHDSNFFSSRGASSNSSTRPLSPSKRPKKQFSSPSTEIEPTSIYGLAPDSEEMIQHAAYLDMTVPEFLMHAFGKTVQEYIDDTSHLKQFLDESHSTIHPSALGAAKSSVRVMSVSDNTPMGLDDEEVHYDSDVSDGLIERVIDAAWQARADSDVQDEDDEEEEAIFEAMLPDIRRAVREAVEARKKMSIEEIAMKAAAESKLDGWTCRRCTYRNSDIQSDICLLCNTKVLPVRGDSALVVIAVPESALMLSGVSCKPSGALRDHMLYLDSGASSHLLHTDLLFSATNVHEIVPPKIFGGVGGEITAHLMGDGRYISDIYFTADTPKNLISLGQLRLQGFKIDMSDDDTISAEKAGVVLVFKQNAAKMFPMHRVVIRGDLHSTADPEAAFTNAVSYTVAQRDRAVKARRWHVATGHMGQVEMKESLSRGNQARVGITVADLSLAERILGPCQVCIRAKSNQPRLTEPTRERTTVIGHTQHVDALYFRDTATKLRTMFLFVDEASNKVCVQLGTSKSKSQFAEALQAVNSFYLRFSHSPVKRIYSDNESAVVAYEPDFNAAGGEIIFKAPGQHVGLAERYVGIFKEITRTLLFQLDYIWPVEYFEDLVHEVVQLMDMRNNSKTGSVPVGEVVKGVRIDYAFMDVPFGAYILATNTRQELKKDNEPRAIYGIVLRRSFGPEMRYKVLPLDQSSPNGQPFFCKKVVELPMPADVREYLNSLSKPRVTPDNYFDTTLRGAGGIDPNVLSETEIRDLAIRDPDAFDTMLPVGQPVVTQINRVPVDPEPVQDPEPVPDLSIQPESSPADYPEPDPEPVPEQQPEAPSVRRAFRRIDPALRDQAAVQTRDDPSLGRGKRHAKAPVMTAAEAISHELFESGLDFNIALAIFEKAYIAKVGANMSFKKASEKHGTVAVDAGHKEISAMLDKNIFEPVDWNSLSAEMKSKTIRTFTFYKEKFKVDGSLEKLKARMVANGKTIDRSTLGDIAAPTPVLEAIFLLYSLAAQFNWLVTVMDVPAAFLHSRLPEEQRCPMILSKAETDIVILIHPEWKKYVRPDGTLPVMLLGSLYGHPSSPMLFNDDLSAAMVSLGYEATESDRCIFVKFDSAGNVSIVLIHVDDLLHMHSSAHFQKELFDMLSKKFSAPTVNSGDEGIHLGIEYKFNRSDRSVRLTMEKYVDKVIKDFHIVSGAKTPTSADFMDVDESSPHFDQRLFASGVMTLYYLSQRVRRDLLFPLTVMASRAHDCRDYDARKLDRIFRYLYATRHRGLVLRSRGTQLVFSIDASYGIHINSRSHTGLYVTLGGEPSDDSNLGGCIFAKSTIQKLVSYSSYEAEINAIHNSRDVIIRLRSLLSDFGFCQLKPSRILEDNMAALVAIQQGEKFRGRASHVNIRVHGISQLVECGAVEFVYCPTEIMLADGLTKPFPSRFQLPVLFELLNDYGFYFGDVFDDIAKPDTDTSV